MPDAESRVTVTGKGVQDVHAANNWSIDSDGTLYVTVDTRVVACYTPGAWDNVREGDHRKPKSRAAIK